MNGKCAGVGGTAKSLRGDTRPTFCPGNDESVLGEEGEEEKDHRTGDRPGVEGSTERENGVGRGCPVMAWDSTVLPPPSCSATLAVEILRDELRTHKVGEKRANSVESEPSEVERVWDC